MELEMNVRELSSEELSHELHLAGKTWAISDKDWFWIQEAKKILLSELTLKYEQDFGITKAQTKARIDPEFKDHVEKMKKYNEDRNMAKVLYDELQIETRRRLSHQFIKNREFSSGSLVT